MKAVSTSMLRKYFWKRKETAEVGSNKNCGPLCCDAG